MGADTLQQHLAAALARLAATTAPAGGQATRLEAELLLAFALDRPRSFLLAHPEFVPDCEVVRRFEVLLARLAAGEPLAYLTGEREFWSLPLQVTPAVLVPRPETELVVERALALRPEAGARVLDLGTGSGAIALALARERPRWHIVATDVSEAALSVARANAERLVPAGPPRRHEASAMGGAQPGIEFLLGSWFEPLHGRRFELIASNPPYVAMHDPALRALRHEPALALQSGPEGLDALHALIGSAGRYLQPGGHIVLEHGAQQGDAVARALVLAGFRHVRCHRDLAGRERVTEAQWP